jgi:protein phosphatase
MSHEALRSLATSAGADLLLVGHTHWPVDLSVDGVGLVNPGSVSNAFPPDLRASYLLLEAGESGFTTQHRRVDYDREAVIHRVERVNHPAASFVVRFMRGEIRM